MLEFLSVLSVGECGLSLDESAIVSLSSVL